MSTALPSNKDLIFKDGALSLRGPAALLFRKIEQDIKKFADVLSAEEIILSGAISFENFSRSGYLQRFPHFANLLSTIDTNAPFDLNTLKTQSLQKVCCSAVCLSCYPLFEDQLFKPSENLTLTALGHVFRKEVIDPNQIERADEFNMREIIFFGSADFVKVQLEACISWLNQLIIDCQLQGGVEVAEDSFFGADALDLKAYQQAVQSKFELLLIDPKTKKKIAVASTNNHGNHFAKSYKMTFQNGDFIHTGCFGMGLERMVLLIHAQYGLDPKTWPKALQNRFGF